MELILNKFTKDQIIKATAVKAVIFDVDGVLTNGGIIYADGGEELKIFNVKDGFIIKRLKYEGIIVGAITGRSSEVVKRRCEELNLDFYHQGIKDKFGCIDDLLANRNISWDDIAYVGDDIIDIKCIVKAGLGVAPCDALDYVKEKADLVTSHRGGEGVLREVSDLILASKGLLQKIVDSYLD